jgi:PAS domain S-box-containing protein
MAGEIKHNNSAKTGTLDMAAQQNRQKDEFTKALCDEDVLIVQDGKIRESNQLLAELCGYAVEEVLDTEFASFFHPDDMDSIEKICNRVTDNANSIEINVTTLMCKNGVEKLAEITAGPFVYNHKPAVLFNMRDISDPPRFNDAVENKSRSQAETEIPIS